MKKEDLQKIKSIIRKHCQNPNVFQVKGFIFKRQEVCLPSLEDVMIQELDDIFSGLSESELARRRFHEAKDKLLERLKNSKGETIYFTSLDL